ncbi:hypothetical protein VTI74DRAFT_4720 [Chaetomium olivicolor]
MVSFFADYYVNQKIETSVRRTFIFVEIADDACPVYVHELLGHLSHLAHNSDFSICVASGYHPEIIEEGNVISIPLHLRNGDDILRYVNLNLVAEWEERNRLVVKIVKKAGGVFLWAEIVVNILNAATMEGATQEMIEYTLEEIPDDLHGLYEWMLSALNDCERAESLILFQWVMLAAEPMRLNDLFLAVRLTHPNPFDLYEQQGPLMAFNIGAPFSTWELRQLRNSEITSDTPHQFHRWLRARSIGLLELRSDSPSTNEPLGLRRVHPIHPSVQTFFLSSPRGFATLSTSNPSIPPSLPLSTFLDIFHITLLRACLTYLNMRDFEPLGHGASRRRKRSSSPTTPSLFPPSPYTPLAATRLPHCVTSLLPPSTIPTTNAPSISLSATQRHLITTSYPFLAYATHNLLHHLLAPTPFRYFLPQQALFGALARDDFRLWKRWTVLLGSHDPAVILQRHSAPGREVARLLEPVFGARVRVERVLRKVSRLASAGGAAPGLGGGGGDGDVMRDGGGLERGRERGGGMWTDAEGGRGGCGGGEALVKGRANLKMETGDGKGKRKEDGKRERVIQRGRVVLPDDCRLQLAGMGEPLMNSMEVAGDGMIETREHRGVTARGGFAV